MSRPSGRVSHRCGAWDEFLIPSTPAGFRGGRIRPEGRAGEAACSSGIEGRAIAVARAWKRGASPTGRQVEQ